MEQQVHTVPNIEKSIVILELLARNNKGLRLSEIIQATGIPKTSTFRILNTFLGKGYLEKEAESKFRLSRKFLWLGMAAVGEESLVEKSIGLMRRLRDEINETILLGARMGNKIIMLEQVIGNHPFTFYLKPGKQVDFHASAPGKAYLAFVDKKERDDLIGQMEFQKFNERTILTPEALTEHLKEVKQQGYGVDYAEELEGVHCISAPVFSASGYPIALLWTTGPSSRLPAKSFAYNGDLLKQYALDISSKLGFKG